MFLDATAPHPNPGPRRRTRIRFPAPSIGSAPVSGRALALAFAFGALLLLAGPWSTATAQQLAPPIDPGRRLDLALRHLDQTARLLYVTAHPDDEDSGLLARLHFRDGVRVRLLTLTRGEGGQNEIGKDLFDALGVLRSRELEGSAEWLGNEQRFSSAFEFGYSFSVEETYALWNEELLLRDIVQQIREFRPDVILTMQPDGEGGGQHHQASARLAESAFEIAATSRWPELGPPHTTRRLFHQLWREDGGPVHVDIDLGVYDPLLGATYEEYGLRARESHQCQGMARLHAPLTQGRSRWRWVRSAEGPGAGDPTRPEDAPHETVDFFAGLPVRLSDRRDPFSGKVVPAVEAARTAFAAGREEAGIAGLEEIWSLVAEGGPNSGDETRTRVGEALAGAWGLTIHARADHRYLAAGDSLHIDVLAASRRPVEFSARALGPGLPSASEGTGWFPLSPDEPASRRLALRLDPEVDPTLTRPVPRPGERPGRAAGEFASPRWSPFQIQPVVRLPNGTRVELDPVPILHQEVDPDHPRVLFADLHVVPEPSVRPLVERIPVLVAASGAETAGGAETDCTWLVSSLEGGPVEVALTLPAGWSADPPTLRIPLRPETEVPVTFSLRTPRQALPGDAVVTAQIRHLESGAVSRTGYERIEYDHVRPGALLVQAQSVLVPIPCATIPGVRIAYVDGSGDQTLAAIERLGYRPTRLDEAALLQGDLGAYDVIVTGVRAYKVREDLAAAHPRLRAWMERGGVLLVQYNKLEFNAGETESSPFAPFPGTLVGRRRVTVEGSPVVLTHPEHPLFHHPNEIRAADWDGWVQERGLYFLDFRDDRYTDLLTLEDPWPYNAGPKGGALVDAQVGKGHWVYLGVGLFRQLPAAVPGAYRLLANLIALAAKETP